MNYKPISEQGTLGLRESGSDLICESKLCLEMFIWAAPEHLDHRSGLSLRVVASEDAITGRQAEELCASGSSARKKVSEGVQARVDEKEKQTYLRGGSGSRHFDIILRECYQSSSSSSEAR